MAQIRSQRPNKWYLSRVVPVIAFLTSFMVLIGGASWLSTEPITIDGKSAGFIFLLIMLVCGLLWLLLTQLARLHQSRENLRLTLESSTDIVVLLDSSARYIDIFATTNDQLIASPEASRGKFVRELMGDELGHRVEKIIAEVLENGKKQTMSYSLPLGGKSLWFEAVLSRRDANTVVAMIRDVTMQKELTQQLEEERARQISASRLASLGEMAGGVAHEINNPLAIISGYAGRLQDMLQQEPLPKERSLEMVRRIEDTTKRIAAIVKGLRAISRDGGSDAKESTLVESVVNDTLGLCFERFRSQGVTIETKIQRGLSIRCRSVQISQVLLNLLTNAFFAVSRQAESKILVEAKSVDQDLEISVIDSGKGVAPEIRERIFEPFFTTKPVGVGTGLGLSIAASIVRDHDGELWLDSMSPQTRFVIRLPLATP